MSDNPTDFDPESPEEREIAAKAARERSDFPSLMGQAYRGEIGRTTSWRARIDRTTNWAVVLTATLLTWRSRWVRLLEDNVFANVLGPEDVEQSDWRELLSEDLREPTMKTPALEAISRRLRRVYFPPHLRPGWCLDPPPYRVFRDAGRTHWNRGYR